MKTIKEACDRVGALERETKNLSDVALMLHRDNQRGAFPDQEAPISIGKYQGRYCRIPVDLLLKTLEQSEKQARDEIARLQPVIDMADAALRGIEKI